MRQSNPNLAPLSRLRSRGVFVRECAVKADNVVAHKVIEAFGPTPSTPETEAEDIGR